jgi:hypothetical protein
MKRFAIGQFKHARRTALLGPILAQGFVIDVIGDIARHGSPDENPAPVARLAEFPGENGR